MTVRVLRGLWERFLEVGINNYVSEPLAPPDLMKVLKCWLPREHDRPGTLG